MIDVKDICFAYNGAPVLKDLSFSVKTGEFMGIIGPNGAGKSTLLKLMDRIILPLSGEINLQDKPLTVYPRKALARLIGFVPQELTSAFRYSARDIVLMGRFPYQRPFGFETPHDIRIATEAMHLTDCYDLRMRNFLNLSGGERQRVVLASALAQEPQILLLDEPTTALDIKHQIHFYEILKKLQQDKRMTILTVTHDVNLAAQFCQRIMVIKEGTLVADGEVRRVLTKDILEKVYETSVLIVSHPVSGLPVILPGLTNKRFLSSSNERSKHTPDMK